MDIILNQIMAASSIWHENKTHGIPRHYIKSPMMFLVLVMVGNGASI